MAHRLVSAERLSARITGHVQGVGFRWWILRRAHALGITGWVMNAAEERAVELVAEGSSESLAELEALLKVGPEGARVEEVAAGRSVASGEFDTFGITRP